MSENDWLATAELDYVLDDLEVQPEILTPIEGTGVAPGAAGRVVECYREHRVEGAPPDVRCELRYSWNARDLELHWKFRQKAPTGQLWLGLFDSTDATKTALLWLQLGDCSCTMQSYRLSTAIVGDPTEVRLNPKFFMQPSE